MAITILPLYFTVPLLIYFGLILAVGIDSLIKVIKHWKLKKIGSRDLIIGLIISLTLYGSLNFIYPKEKGTFSMIFVGPFLLLFLPVTLYLVTKNIKKVEFLSKGSLIAVSCSMVGIVLKMIFNSLYS